MNEIEEIYKEYFSMVYRYIFCLTHDSYLSEEITQDTFLIAIMKINSFRKESKISTWLCRIAQNLLYNKLKHNQKIVFISNEKIKLLKDFENIEDVIILNEEKKMLNEKIEKLDKVSRKVVYFRIEGELKFKEIGDIFNKSENWARVIFYRAKNKLKEGENYENERL